MQNKKQKHARTASKNVGKTPAESAVEMTEIVLPQHTNALGTVFGGVVMSWVDIAAAVAATRHCRRPAVTASVDALQFLAPIKLGWFVTIKASVNFASKHSCEVGVKVMSENPMTGERFHTSTAYTTFVALDAAGKPTAIPPVIPSTDVERERYEAAQKRRAARLVLREQIRKRRSHHD